MHESTEKPILLLVDGHSLAFRSFYAFSKGGEGGLATKEGVPTSVTYGFLKALLDNCKVLCPQGVTIAFDTAEPTFRHKADPNYKANRDVAPEIFFQDLTQLQLILKEQLNLPLCMAPGYEADDVLGTLANEASKDGWRVRILSGDRDLFQLVDDEKDIAVLYMGGGGPYAKSNGPVLINEAGVEVKLGVTPKKVVDLKALTGDSSDNIPGVKGVGPKTAINLLKENGDLDGVYNALAEIDNEGEKACRGAIKGAVKSKLRNDKKNAYLSRELAQILVRVPLQKKPSFHLGKVSHEGLKQQLELLELNSLVRQVPSFVATFSTGGFLKNQKNLKSEPPKDDLKAKQLSTKHTAKKENTPPNLKPCLITKNHELEELVKQLMSCKDPLKPVALDTETTHLNPFKAELVGIGVCWDETENGLAYVPIGHNDETDLLENKSLTQLPLETVLSALGPWLASESHPKTLQNAKYDRLILLRHGLQLKGVVMDTLLGDYLRDSNDKHGLDIMSKREFNFAPIPFNELVAKGKTFADVDIDTASQYCGMDVHLTRRLATRLRQKLTTMGPELIELLEKVEQPLEPVLADMESNGIRIDIPYLNKLSNELSNALKQLEQKAYTSAGINFNLASPKQLGEILFDNLGLDRKKSRRTKTGWSTDANVLEKLEADHPVVGQVIEHRVLSKLLSTYVDALPQLVEKETGRVHTDFNQAVTATGRLSSSNPNLQNIPIRTEFSRRIRKAFLPQENWKLLSADYSQIELRILAHLSEEEMLRDAYRKQEDVHTLTAKLLLEKDSISPDERRVGKTINFGVIYGMGAQRLARSTGLSQTEAKEFLNRYRKRYPKIFSFLELQERLALSKGYVKTLLGRRRLFNFNQHGLGRLLGKDPYEIDLNLARRGGLEAQQLRAAANAPIQGSSADIIKIAMVRLQEKLNQTSLPARLLLQVHDELVLEVDPVSLEEVKQLVKTTMEHAVSLSVPLLVDIGIGDNWMEAK